MPGHTLWFHGPAFKHQFRVVPYDSHSCETVVCQACSRLHFINRSNGKLLGAEAPG